MVARAFLAVGVIAAVFISGCTPSHKALSGPSGDRLRTGPVAPLSPSIPDVFRTGVNHCGDPYALNATTVTGTVPLVDCPGLAGLHPMPSVVLTLRGEVTIAGLHGKASITTAPTGLLQAHGTTFVAIHPGTTIITVHDYPCVPDDGSSQRSSCPLMQIQTR